MTGIITVHLDFYLEKNLVNFGVFTDCFFRLWPFSLPSENFKLDSSQHRIHFWAWAQNTFSPFPLNRQLSVYSKFWVTGASFTVFTNIMPSCNIFSMLLSGLCTVLWDSWMETFNNSGWCSWYVRIHKFVPPSSVCDGSQMGSD